MIRVIEKAEGGGGYVPLAKDDLLVSRKIFDTI
jgi:hypothetical protein